MAPRSRLTLVAVAALAAARPAHALGARAPQEDLRLEAAPPAGVAGAVRFRRAIAGLPVLNGSVHVAVGADGATRRVRAGEPIAATSGRFAIEGADAARGALAALGEATRQRGEPVARAGWWAMGGVARAVYEVEHATEEPEGEWRSVVDAETGRVLFREDARLHASARGRVYDLSPVQGPGGASCPLAPGGYPAACATTELVAFSNLVAETTLTGSQISVYDCRGGAFPTAPGTTAGCAQVEHPATDAGSDGAAYDFSPDPTGTSTTDDFAAAMAYYQLDRHYTFLKGLDPAAKAALLVAVPAFVNAYSGGLPYDNAHYSSSLKGVVLGQGTSADFAYDASVMFHELTHAVVDMRGGFRSGLDSLGALEEPTAVNEGTADSLAAAHAGSSLIGPYVASFWLHEPFLRDLENGYSCQGNGVPDDDTYVDGLYGEPHADGEIWNGFYGEVAQGLAGLQACDGACDAAAAIQAAAMGLGAGGSPTLRSYADDMVEAARAVLPERPEVADYVQCVAARRSMDRCDRTFHLYAGESKAQYIRRGYGTFQLVIETTGPAALAVCSMNGTSAHARLRRSQPVALSFTPSGSVSAEADASVALSRPCSSTTAWDAVGLPSAGTWYLLVDAPGAIVPNDDVFAVHAWPAGVAARPSAAPPPTCALGKGPVPTPTSPAPTPAPAASPGSAIAAGGGQVSSPGGKGGCSHAGGPLALLAVPALLARRRW